MVLPAARIGWDRPASTADDRRTVRPPGLRSGIGSIDAGRAHAGYDLDSERASDARADDADAVGPEHRMVPTGGDAEHTADTVPPTHAVAPAHDAGAADRRQ